MEPFISVSGIAAPLMHINIDTDQITPGPFILRAYSEGWAVALFGNWKFRPDGSLDPDFILNRKPWNAASILLADRNFGCGSSRESAPKALRASGFRVIIAPTFGGIFFNNCFRNGLLPVELPIEQVKLLAAQVEESQGIAEVSIDLEKQEVVAPGGERFRFDTPAHFRRMLLGGLDEIGYTLTNKDLIEAFWTKDVAVRPWVYAVDAQDAEAWKSE